MGATYELRFHDHVGHAVCRFHYFAVHSRSPWMCIALVLVLPFLCVMLIGLSSPQRGQQLDPTGRWYFNFVVQTWAMIWIGIVIIILATAIFPSFRI
jgi:ABC-type spermidine/putrescine transport system permease subunit II